MDYLCPDTCKEILTHYIKKHQKVGKEMMEKHRQNPHKPLQLQDIMAHQELAELVDLCHEIYHIVIELGHGREIGEPGKHDHDMYARREPGHPMQAGMHTGPAPGLTSIVGKPHP